MKKIDFVEQEFTDGKFLSERYMDLTEGAAGRKEVEAASDEIMARLRPLIVPAQLQGIEFPNLPEEIRKAYVELEDLVSNFDSLCVRSGFNAGYEAGFADGVILGRFGGAKKSKAAEARN